MNEFTLKMQELPEQSRPYERIYTVGPKAATNSELLAVLVQSGTAKYSAIDIAHQLLSDEHFHSLDHLSNASVEQLQAVPGIGPVKAVRILSALELGRRSVESEVPKEIACDSPRACARVLIPELGHRDREAFAVLFLNRRNRLIRSKVYGEGSLSRTIIEPRDVFRDALKFNAAGMVLGHNHPSGHLEPSESDLKSTAVFIELGQTMGLYIVDHLIVSRTDWLSLRESTSLFDHN